MKSKLINRWYDLRAILGSKGNSKRAGWIVDLFEAWRIEAILEDRYGYDIALNGTTTI